MAERYATCSPRSCTQRQMGDPRDCLNGHEYIIRVAHGGGGSGAIVRSG